MTEFGPPYLKINSAFKRNASIPGNPVIPGEWSCPEFEYLANLPWRWTEKIDGTNIRLWWEGQTVTLGGRTDRAQIPASIVEAVAKLGLMDPGSWQVKWPWLTPQVDELRPSVTLYGEGYGAGIQKGGGNYRSDAGFILFDVRVGHWWLEPYAVQEIADYFGLDTVPAYGVASPSVMWEVIKHEGLKSHFPGVEMEGIVGTPAVPLQTRSGHRLIMKMKQRDWTEYARVHNVI
jgi:hypothetical protein